MNVAWLLGAVALIGCSGGTTVPQPLVASDDSFPEPPPEPPPVAADLIADTDAVAPGALTRVAVRFTIAPGWKIYWSNPGEAGLPTIVSLDPPDGFDVGAVTYPAPHAFDGPGGVLSYGYSKEVLLSALVRAPATVDGDDVTVVANARWLACNDVCKRGGATLELTLPVAASAGDVGEVDAELFTRHLSRVPMPLDRDACAISADPDHKRAVIDCAGVSTLELFPARDTQQILAGQLSRPSTLGARLELSYAAADLPPRVNGVLRAESAGNNRYYNCDESL